jgi:hypothetical protein
VIAAVGIRGPSVVATPVFSRIVRFFTTIFLITFISFRLLMSMTATTVTPSCHVTWTATTPSPPQAGAQAAAGAVAAAGALVCFFFILFFHLLTISIY